MLRMCPEQVDIANGNRRLLLPGMLIKSPQHSFFPMAMVTDGRPQSKDFQNETDISVLHAGRAWLLPSEIAPFGDATPLV